MRKSLPLLLASILTAVYCQAEDKPVHEKPTTVRFLCVAADLPSKFNRLPNGFYVPIPFAFDERPPMTVCRKEGEAFKPVPFVPSGVSQPLIISDKKKDAGGDFFFEGETSTESAESVLTRGAGATGAPGTASKAAKATKPANAWHLLAECPKTDGKDHLICLFNPNPNTKWYPAKTLDLDISEKVFGTGQCMTINLSAKPVYIQAGEKTKPVALAPGGTFAISTLTPDTAGEFRLKVAAVISPSKTSVVFNRSMPTVAGKRSLIVLHEAHSTASIPVEVQLFQIDNTAPTESSSNPRVSQATR